MNWSFQLYSARNFTPWSDVLSLLARLGYAHVEGFGGVYEAPAAFRNELDRNGLTMPSGHFALDALEGDFDGVRRIADMLGMSMLICPYLAPDDRPSDAAGWRAFGERLARIGAKTRSAGYEFAWHNHDFEVMPLSDGSVPLAHMLKTAPDIGLELDVAWAARGGADPLQCIDAHASRIIAVHVKDIAPAGQNAADDGWADIGHGTLDWEGLLARLQTKTPARIYAIEHDNPSDIERFARRSLAAVRSFEKTR